MVNLFFNSLSLLYIVKVALALIFLVEASRRDLKERIVSNKLWMYMLSVFVPLDVLEYFIHPFNLAFAFIQIIFIFVFSYVIYLLGLYGGADAKAFMVLAVAFPEYPTFFGFPIFGKGIGMFAFATLANSVIAAPLLVLYIFLRNLFSGNLDFPYMFIGYRLKLEKVKFHNLLEYVEGDKIVKKLRGIEADEKMIEKLRKKGVEEVWVSPALPFMCFITVGFLISVFFGDLMYLAIKCLI